MEGQKRHIDPEDSVYDFAITAMVRCPRCEGRAQVRPHEPSESSEGRDQYRVTCVTCTFTKQAEAPGSRLLPPFQVLTGAPVDWIFELPLWLVTTCRGQTLWAFNGAHIAAIESYIAAEHRQRQPGPAGWHNRSMLSRLPRWMIEAHAREDVLAGLGRLRAML